MKGQWLKYECPACGAIFAVFWTEDRGDPYAVGCTFCNWFMSDGSELTIDDLEEVKKENEQ